MKVEFEALQKQILFSLGEMSKKIGSIDEGVKKINGRVSENENSISSAKGAIWAMGVVGLLLGLVLTFLSLRPYL